MAAYDSIFQRLGAYGAVLVMGPLSCAIQLAQAVAAKEGLFAFTACTVASSLAVGTFGMQTPTPLRKSRISGLFTSTFDFRTGRH